jgi:hypothetical protein
MGVVNGFLGPGMSKKTMRTQATTDAAMYTIQRDFCGLLFGL